MFKTHDKENPHSENIFHEWRLTRLRGNWALTFNDAQTGKRHRHNLKTRSRHEASKLAPALFEELTRPKGAIIDALVGAYRQDKAGRTVDSGMRYIWRRLGRYFSGREADTVTIADCRAYLAMRRKEGVKDSTIRAELLSLRTVLHWAENHKLISKAPYIEVPKSSPPRERYLSQDEVQKLLYHAKAVHIRLAIVLMLATAARIKALLELTWDRVDFERNLIQLHKPHDGQANYKGRAIVPINKSLQQALREAYRFANTDFVLEWHGRPLKTLSGGLRETARRASIKDVSPHVFRHTAAVWMAEAGISMSVIAQYLEHSNTAITGRVYARYSPEYLKEAASALEIEF